MKRFLLLCLLAIMSTSGLLAETPYYFIFSNLEKQNGHIVDDNKHIKNATISDMVDYYYKDIFDGQRDFAPYTKKVSFAPSTFSKYPIEQMDITVFPLGTDYTLSSTVGGVKIIDKIQELLDAGKGVIVVSHMQLANIKMEKETDKTTLAFLGDSLGIDIENIGSGIIFDKNESKFLPYEIIGSGIDDKVFQSTMSATLNISMSMPGSTELTHPSRFWTAFTALKLKTGSGSIGGPKVRGGDFRVALRKEFASGGKIMFWSIDWANTARSNKFYDFMYRNCLNWMAEDLPAPSGNLVCSSEDIDFGGIEPGTTKPKTLIIRNNGREDLKITDMRFENEDYPDEVLAYSLDEDQDKQFTLAPQEQASIKITFAPEEEGDYSDALIIYHNGIGNDKRYVNLQGTGGEDVNEGPYLMMYQTDINFDKILAGGTSSRPVTLINDGSTDMTVQKIEFDEETEDFRYADVYKIPIVIKPGEKHDQVIKFTPLEDNKTYKTTMTVETNGINDSYGAGIGNAKITLRGETGSDSKPAGCVLSIGDELKFGKTDSTRVDTVVTIKNTGDEMLYVNAPYFEEGEEGHGEMFSWSPAGKEIEVEPGWEEELTITFKPTKDGEFYGYLYITSNAPGSEGEYEIMLYGEGKDVQQPDTTSGGDGVFDRIPGMTANVYPNPVTTDSKLSIDLEETLQNVDVKLVDNQGRTVSKITNGILSSGSHEFALNLDVSAGKYFIIITAGNKQTGLPIVIQ